MIVAETKRLQLRQFHIADGAAMDRVFGNAEVMRYGRGPQTAEWVRTWLQNRATIYQQRGFGLWAVIERETEHTIGYCGLSHFDDIAGQAETEIGYRLARSSWGRGYATEAACAVRDYGFRTLGLSRLIAIIDPRNTASAKVAEKTGLQFEKDALFNGVAVHIYSMGRPIGG